MSHFYETHPLADKRVQSTPWTDNLRDELNCLTVQINNEKDTTEEYTVAMARCLWPTSECPTFRVVWGVTSHRF